jgi:hypothetical protein
MIAETEQRTQTKKKRRRLNLKAPITDRVFCNFKTHTKTCYSFEALLKVSSHSSEREIKKKQFVSCVDVTRCDSTVNLRDSLIVHHHYITFRNISDFLMQQQRHQQAVPQFLRQTDEGEDYQDVAAEDACVTDEDYNGQIGLNRTPSGWKRPEDTCTMPESCLNGQTSIILCGVPGLHGERIYTEDNRSYFQATVDVYVARDDPQQCTLYRASALAHKFDVANNLVGMYLMRRRRHVAHMPGLYQASGFHFKPRNSSGLKTGGYFVSMDVCMQFQLYMSSRPNQNRYRLKGAVGEKDGRRKPPPPQLQGKPRTKLDERYNLVLSPPTTVLNDNQHQQVLDDRHNSRTQLRSHSDATEEAHAIALDALLDGARRSEFDFYPSSALITSSSTHKLTPVVAAIAAVEAAAAAATAAGSTNMNDDAPNNRYLLHPSTSQPDVVTHVKKTASATEKLRTHTRADANHNYVNASRPFGGRFVVDTIVVSVSCTYECEMIQRNYDRFKFNVMYSDEGVQEAMEKGGLGGLLGALICDCIHKKFPDQFNIQEPLQFSGNSITDPTKFPRRIHFIITRDGSSRGVQEDDEVNVHEVVNPYAVFSLYGYKVHKWGTSDAAVRHDHDWSEKETESDDCGFAAVADDGNDVGTHLRHSSEKYNSGEKHTTQPRSSCKRERTDCCCPRSANVHQRQKEYGAVRKRNRHHR